MLHFFLQGNYNSLVIGINCCDAHGVGDDNFFKTCQLLEVGFHLLSSFRRIDMGNHQPCSFFGLGSPGSFYCEIHHFSKGLLYASLLAELDDAAVHRTHDGLNV